MRRVWPVLAVVLCVAVPWVPGLPPYWLVMLNSVGIAGLVTIGLVVLTGVGGMTSFGQASFMGFGAYTTALLSTHGVSPWLGLLAAIVVAMAAAWLIGFFTLRLAGHYLALGTLAWSVALFYVAANLDALGRNDGISNIPPLSLFGLPLIAANRYFTLVWGIVLLACLATRRLLDSRAGRAMRALRGGGIAAASCGVDVMQARLLAFVYAAALAGIAGWLYAHMQRSVNPTPFSLNASIDFLLMAVAGGIAHIPGALLGAAFVTIANDRLQDWLPALLGSSGSFETIVFGAFLVLLLQVAPEGLWPHLARWRSRKPTRATGPANPLPHRPMPAPGTDLLDVAGLRRGFGGLVAVDDLSFAVEAGGIMALIGPNGAGKSTSFNLLTGLLRPDRGTVLLAGRPIGGMAPRRVAALGVARSFQHVRLIPSMTLAENVAIGAHLRGRAGALAALLRLDRREEAALFAEAQHQLARVGLDGLADTQAGSLPLGQQRLAEIARALCADPLLLLLDEPAAGLRHGEKLALADLLRQLRADGVTILLVEHDMGFVMQLADRLVVLNFGSKLAEGPPAAVRANPTVIAAYLGTPTTDAT